MPRIARVVVPGLPHHVTQRGNRRQKTFFTPDNYRVYLALLRWWAPRTGVKIWSYCLMPNHVHLVAVPSETGSLAACMTEVHQRYTHHVNTAREWTGCLWQGRFHSTVMDAAHAVVAARYVAMNPVRAGLVATPHEWPHSSARTHLGMEDDRLVDQSSYVGLIDDWRALFASGVSDEEIERVRLHTRTGRPLGEDAFVLDVESRTGRTKLARPKGRPPKPKLSGPHPDAAEGVPIIKWCASPF